MKMHLQKEWKEKDVNVPSLTVKKNTVIATIEV